MSTTGSAPLNLHEWTSPERLLPNSSPLVPVDARGADWHEMDLGELDLRGAKLCRCDLRGTDLSHCQLDGADLRLARYDNQTVVPVGFDLNSSGAVGPGARLNGVYLNSTDLRGMDLRGSMLLGTYLSGADLSGAIRLVHWPVQIWVINNARSNVPRDTIRQLRTRHLIFAGQTLRELYWIRSNRSKADFPCAEGSALN